MGSVLWVVFCFFIICGEFFEEVYILKFRMGVKGIFVGLWGIERIARVKVWWYENFVFFSSSLENKFGVFMGRGWREE